MSTSTSKTKRASSKISLLSGGAKQTEKFGIELGKALKNTYFENAVVISLSGDLGAGKTTLIRGLARGLGIKKKITSPTFLIMRVYRFLKDKRGFYHIDAYRIENKRDAGVLEKESYIFKNKLNIIVIEWPEKIKYLIPKNKIFIQIEHGEKETERTIKIT